MNSEINISVLLPTRGRTKSLETSLVSLAELAEQKTKLEFLLAFDDDDSESFEWFLENIAPQLDAHGVTYQALGFERLGYIRLNEYLNALAKHAQGSWLLFWGDDAIMHTQGWDQRIMEVKDFYVLRMPAHRQHPYAIFPIVPRAWTELFGYLSPHQLTDSWVSQVAYMLDIMHDIPVEITHDRFDLTGNNNDETYANRPMLEGNAKDPRDFNHQSWRQRRLADCRQLNKYLKAQGRDGAWFDRVLRGEQDPWEKMTSPERDPNRQIAKFS
jgi:hypothetical protein